ncbi:ATP-binding cassette domain-containing protein [Aneurinibacillus thermoaerophilus]|uniref:Molybdate transport system ATP-binding protein n=1 Tax=Aneurinibacillus thermoaerophilus TaxID=143495 RepID=A0A1G8CR68_ANETH|nr:ATP-binding cassette domain-containing protein [Aneurinibacillus thermoaerophilus]MED0677198.1 ATP-binding cassette domain-containing protein [Aneurinibacillus thermoaerophilus]MED0680494.1 ATP-binding cassette domain-containing protein [Aneurinibacillus thermoaerophilus]MED0737246.1 ATP-binding cassette domain-containing protein [Aneurinibacillus thermoaerophilus]MED0757939.1 ATP-binding cassette domain-containing protein [Aneurinibacillus thermoaerophilus]MED0761637.1 ATP-binding cassette
MLSVEICKKLPHFLLDVQFEAEDEIIILFGPSGSGKTTILNSIAGIVQPDAGLIQLNGLVFFDGKAKPLPTRARRIGYLFQDYALFPHMTVEKNILYGVRNKRDHKKRALIEKLLDVLKISHLLPKYPHQISGGEKQRTALARALATEPELLLLDEPFSALDKDTRLQCQNELLELHRMWRIPVLLVTHDEEEAKKLGNRVLFLKQGKIR